MNDPQRAAVSAENGATAGLVAEWHGRAHGERLRGPWRELAVRALEPNVFHDPDFLLPALAVFDADAKLLVVRASADHRLVAVVPIVERRIGFGITGRMTAVFTSDYSPLGSPLIDPERAVDVWLAILEALRQKGRSAVLLPHLRLEGPVWDALLQAVQSMAGGFAIVESHKRAVLNARDGAGQPMAEAVPAKRRREWGRLWRRFMETGPVSADEISAPEAIDQAFHQFLALEAGGWKGRGGTALAQSPAIKTFAETAVHDLARRGQVRIDRIAQGDRPAAVLIRLSSGAECWTWKMAYDEAFSASSPGYQVVLHGTDRVLADPSIRRTDSLASAAHPLMDHVWKDRLSIGTVVVDLTGSSWRARFGSAEISAYLAAKRTAREARDRLTNLLKFTMKRPH